MEAINRISSVHCTAVMVHYFSSIQLGEPRSRCIQSSSLAETSLYARLFYYLSTLISSIRIRKTDKLSSLYGFVV